MTELEGGDGGARHIVAGILHLAEGMGVPVIAEGIETESARVLVAEMGCQLGQGFHLGRPARAETFDDAWIERLPLVADTGPVVTEEQLPGHW